MDFSLSAAQISKTLNQSFPQEISQMMVAARIDEPTVRMRDRMEITLPASIRSLGSIAGFGLPAGETFRVNTTVAGTIDYDPAEGQFYFVNPEVLGVDSALVPEHLKPIVQQALGMISGQLLDRIPVYQLDANDRKQRWAKSWLERAEVRGDRLHLLFKRQ